METFSDGGHTWSELLLFFLILIVLIVACTVYLIKKQELKTAKCPNCGQRTTKALSCQWCSFPLLGKPIKEREEKVKKPKELKPPKEKPVTVQVPFGLSFIGYLLAVILVVMFLGGALYGVLRTDALDNTFGSNSLCRQIKAIVNPAKPTVVSKEVYETAPSRDYTIIVRCEVRNDRGSRNVLVIALGDAYGQRFSKNKIIYLRSGETQVREFPFSEVTVERRLLETLLKILLGRWRSALENPNIRFDVHAQPAR